MTIKQLKALSGREFECEAIGGRCVEDIPVLRKALLEKYGDELEEDDNSFTLRGGSSFILKPRISRLRRGTITFRSRDYIFTQNGKASFGDMPKSVELTGEGFTVEAMGGMELRYKLIQQ